MRKPPNTERRRLRAHLGRCLELARARSTLSQDDVATQLEVRRATVGAWESGESEPPTGDLLRLADLYGVTLDELTGRAPLPPPERKDT